MTRIFLIIMMFLISGCSEWSLKRSANNKLLDFKGFEGSKRRPLYNKKYINRAKRNIVDENYEEDDYDGTDEMDEIVDTASQNRSMYKGMVKKDARRKSQGSNTFITSSNETNSYPKLSKARSIVDEGNAKSSEDLQSEIAELKKMMIETKKDLSKYRCPMQNNTNPPQDIRPKQHKARSLSNSIGVD